MTMLVQYLKQLWQGPAGRAAAAFLRVFLATVVACWVDAGLPVRDLTGDSLVGWVELGIQTGFALVLANYFGPWESRYGRNKGSARADAA